MKIRLINEAVDPNALSPENAGEAEPARVIRKSLHEQLVSSLRDMIQTGELPPGSVISESGLCLSLGVSRTPLREALKVLSSENLVQLRPHRTPLVSDVNPVEVAELFELLSIIEPAAGALACQRASLTEINGLYRMHDQLMEFYAARERTRYFTFNQAIHHEIVRLSGNKVLLSTYVSVQSRAQRARSTANLDQDRWAESVDEHEKLLDAFRDRDDEAVRTLLHDHTRQTANAVLRSLAMQVDSAAR